MMTKNKLVIYAFILLVLAVSAYAITFTDYRLQPSSIATDYVYWYLDVDNLTLFYDYDDGRLNILQDWHGTIYYNGVANVTMPPSIARYTFDYDAGNGTSTFNENNTVVDQSTAQRHYDGIRNNMFMEGIIAYFGFEDNNETHTYDWANRTLANLTGVELVEGRKGQAYSFSTASNSRIVISDSADLRLTGGGTIAAWIKPDSYGESEGGKIVDKAEDSSADSGYSFYVWDDYTLNFDIQPSDFPGNPPVVSVQNAITPGVWQHVAVTFDNTGRHLYVNGVDVTASGGEVTDSPWNIADEIVIGNLLDELQTNFMPFDGLIDEVYIFNRTITSRELEILADATCNKGYCYDFDGVTTRSITIPSHTYDLDSGAAFSWWMKVFNEDVTATGQTIIGNSIITTYKFIILSGTERVQIETDSNADTATSTPIIFSNTWHHYAVSCLNYRCSFYRDGINITEEPIITYPEITLDQIGMAGSAGRNFNGTIDDIRIFNNSLTEEQVRFIYLDTINISNLASTGDYYMSLNASLLTHAYNFTTPNTTLRDGTLNITIFEEDTGTSLSGTNATIETQINDVSTDYWTDTGNKTITGLIGGLWTLTIGAPSFGFRTYEATLSGYETVDVVAYLVPNSSETVIFNVQNADNGESVEGAFATMYRNIGDSFQVVESRYTDITGRVLFSYIPEGEYRFLFTKSGFEELLFTLNPIVFSSYNIEMDPSTTINQSQDLDKISLVYGPTLFYNNLTKNFTFLISSPFGDLLNYGYTLSYPGGSIAFDGSLAGGEIDKQEYTIIGASFNDLATLYYYYETGIAGHRNFTKQYAIIVEGSSKTMIGIQDNTYGLGLFERLFIAVLGTIMIVGIATLIGRLIPGMALGMFWLGFMVYIGFIPLWSVLITITVSLIMVGMRSEG